MEKNRSGTVLDECLFRMHREFSGLSCNIYVLAYVTSELWEGMPHPLRGLWACCPASSGSCGWDIKRVNFQKLKTLSFLWKEAKIISQGKYVWEVKPPAAVCLCPTCFPFDFSKANTSRWMLEMSILTVQTREERKPFPREDQHLNRPQRAWSQALTK